MCSLVCVSVCVRGRGLEGQETVMIINMIINNIKVKYVYPRQIKYYGCVLLRFSPQTSVRVLPLRPVRLPSASLTHFNIYLHCWLSENTDNKNMVLWWSLYLKLCKNGRFEGAALILVQKRPTCNSYQLAIAGVVFIITLLLYKVFASTGIYIIPLKLSHLEKKVLSQGKKNVRIDRLLWEVNQTLKVKRWQRGPSQSAYPPQVTPHTHLQLQSCCTHPSIPRSCLFFVICRGKLKM